MFTKKNILHQALQDQKSIKSIMPKGVSVIGRGVKIQNFNNELEILNMGKGGDYFKECSEQEYDFFYQHGWKKGSLLVSANNCLFKLKIIEGRIRTELNTRKNDKHIQNLKNRRESLLNKYSLLQTQINKINGNK